MIAKNLEIFSQSVEKVTVEETATSSVLKAKEHGNYWVFANMIKCMIFQKKESKFSAASIKNNYEPISC